MCSHDWPDQREENLTYQLEEYYQISQHGVFLGYKSSPQHSQYVYDNKKASSKKHFLSGNVLYK